MSFSKFKLSSIEGLVAAGKSSTIIALKDKLEKLNIDNILLVPEPVDLFKQSFDGSNRNPLKDFYDNFPFDTFTFQVHVLNCYDKLLSSLLTTTSSKINHICFERSLDSTRVFTQANRQYLTEKELQTICEKHLEIHNKYFGDRIYAINNFVLYLNTDVDLAFERCVKRNRPEEKSMTKAYLSELEKQYMNYTDDINCTVIKLDPLKVDIVAEKMLSILTS